jgi:multimeric flavodoxin WrbA
MAVQVLGISGSPIPNSNTDRAVKLILEQTGLETKFVKLSELSLEPCRACLGCVETNKCVVEDDGQRLAEMFRLAPAFVIGGFTPYSSLDARTKAFMERMYCLRHQVAGNAGKFGASVITSACPPDVKGLPPAAETAAGQIKTWMMMEGMTDLGSLVVLGNVPCIRCGYGDACPVSGIKVLHGPDASIDTVPVSAMEDDPKVTEAAKEIAEKIRQAVLEA